MKTILALLFIPMLALADFPGQNPRPAVTTTELPEFVTEKIRELAKDPESVQIVKWTLPKLVTNNNQGVNRSHWVVYVTTRARNEYNGYVVNEWIVAIRGGSVFFCKPIL